MALRSDSQQAILSSYAPRLRTYNNALLQPVLPSSAPSNPLARVTKRGTTIINYAEDGYDDLDDDEDDGRRRPTGLRSLRRDDSAVKTRLDG
jgi:chromatin structure-remodeling complex subunit SFH1